MYLTQDEAKKKICPHITYQNMVNQYGSTPLLQAYQDTCHASGCMAWRWAGGLPSTEKGYCGLSGRPGPDIFSQDPTTGITTKIT